MGHFDLFLSYISTIFIIIIFHGFPSKAQTPPTYVYNFCTGSNITANSTYKSNLNLLLSSLSSSNNNTIIKNGYFNTTAGRNPDTVFGAFQCRGDDTKEVCQNCVTKASQDVTKSSLGCPNSNQAILIYDECLLRYSNESFFSIMQPRPAVYLSNTASVTDPDQFTKVLGEVMDSTVKEATSNGSSFKNYAIGDKNYTQSKKIYGLAQCTSDLSSSDCNTCLRGAVSELPSCCGGKEGGRVVRASCIVRYEIYPIVGSNLASPPAPAPAPSPPLVLPPKTNTNTTTTTITNSNGTNRSKLVVSIVVPSVIAVLLTAAVWCFCLRRKQAEKKFHDNEIKNVESLQFKFSTISAATNDFSEANKLGEGGFGPVYKGTLSDGQEIAVKRLSRNSGQGEGEFKNEVVLLAKLEHRNLVRLLGFCYEEEEKLLVYEFMPNASLDQFIFDPIKRAYLNWERRYKIIGGIARGLLYLHEDSRLKIIHRDLKASNILLDGDMNPKISDFGMARLFVVDQTQGNTSRIVGTYGYMSPEYAMHGQFSVKSDVFSYGVLILEILCGQKNNSFYESEVAQDLLSYVWIHWKNGSSLDVLDPSLLDNCSRNEVMRCIHIGLLCVQEDISDRPTMASVVLMLNSYSTTIASPSPPAFFAHGTKKSNIDSTESTELPIMTESTTSTSWSVNDVTITEPYPR